jgi:hypothetical protein
VGGWLAGLGLDAAAARHALVESGFETAIRAFVDGREFGVGHERLERTLAAVDADGDLGRAMDALCARVPGDGLGAQLRPFLRRQVALVAVAAAAARAVAAGPDAALTARIRKLHADLVLERVRPLRDAAATGDQVLEFLVRQLPPGSHARVMGMQNIKGTGLDFVYRWESYARVHATLRRLDESSDTPTAQALLHTLREHADIGILDADLACGTVDILARTHAAQWATIGDEVTLTQAHLRRVLARRQRLLARGAAGLRPWRSLLGAVEHVLDFLHSVRRRQRANRVLDDLVHRRISHARAATLMKDITSAQRGGWLRGRQG